MQSHPMQTLERSNSSLLLLDSLVRVFGLIGIDQGLRPRGISPYVATQANADAAQMNVAAQMGFVSPNTHFATNGPTAADFAVPSSTSSSTGCAFAGRSRIPNGVHPRPHEGRGCNCLAVSLGRTWPSVQKLAPSWRATLTWPENLPEGEFAREEARRLVWTAVMAVASRSMYTAATPDNILSHGKLFVSEPEKVRPPSPPFPSPSPPRLARAHAHACNMATQFAVLLPAESLAQAGVAMEADDVWTLSLRTMLLFHVATRVREDPALGAAERAQRAIQAWLEIDDLERRLARHTCEFDSSFGFQAQEMLFGCVARDPPPLPLWLRRADWWGSVQTKDDHVV